MWSSIRLQVVIQDVTDETLMASRNTTTKTLCMALRFIYKTAIQRETPTTMPLLGNFRLIMGTKTDRLIRDLANHLYETDNPTDNHFAMKFLHQFLVTSFTEELSDCLKVASLWELSILLCCMSERNGEISFKSANSTLSILSPVFRIGRSMFVHAAVTGSFHSGIKYPFTSSDDAEPTDSAIQSVISSLQAAA
jgi:hypothetical protein